MSDSFAQDVESVKSELDGLPDRVIDVLAQEDELDPPTLTAAAKALSERQPKL